MKGIWVITLAAALSLAAASAATADELLIEAIQAEQSGQAERPQRGMTMERVRQAFGAPQDRQPAVGEPPITRWQYDAFTVFFEHNRVIHAVSRR